MVPRQRDRAVSVRLPHAGLGRTAALHHHPRARGIRARSDRDRHRDHRTRGALRGTGCRRERFSAEARRLSRDGRALVHTLGAASRTFAPRGASGFARGILTRFRTAFARTRRTARSALEYREQSESARRRTRDGDPRSRRGRDPARRTLSRNDWARRWRHVRITQRRASVGLHRSARPALPRPPARACR